MLVLEVRFLAGGEVGGVARPLDANDIRAPIGQLTNTDGTGPHMGQIQDRQVIQSFRSRYMRHRWTFYSGLSLA